MNPFLQVEAQRGPEACAVLTTLRRWGFGNLSSGHPSLFSRSGGSFSKPTLVSPPRNRSALDAASGSKSGSLWGECGSW